MGGPEYVFDIKFYTIPVIVGDGCSVFEESFGQAECVDCSVQGMQTVAP